MTETATARGRANRNRGNRAEVQVVNWLRDHGYPDARRRLAGDGRQGSDVDGVPALHISVKDVAGSAWPTWCRQAQAEAGGTPWVVVRRLRGQPDVGLWPCVASLTALTPGVIVLRINPTSGPGTAIRRLVPPRLSGYGTWISCHGLQPQAAGRLAWLFDDVETR